MRITICAVGRVKAKYARLGCDDFLSRMKRFFKVDYIELKDIRRGRSDGSKSWKDQEAINLTRHIPKTAFTVVLDEHGKQFSSTQFADWIQAQQVKGTSSLAFLIGGPDGHGESVLKRANLIMSLSTLTLPHELARLVLCEQLYRAGSMMSGHPYHRE
ncbi:MAG: 23S rRNA (pseudouridine(1915)-N(3))-methyltransferase RlmH [Myxococcota bacterium]|nr:23S rRNA (pseudouridine(1915)-N(3))-methyltransferase RlmH [Myxococcota bacterium]